jgi:hypothetical protein
MAPMDKRERQLILGEAGAGADDPREHAGRRQLEDELEGSPLRGRPLPRRTRYFAPSVDRIVAAMGGPLPYMQRLREIELRTARDLEALTERWQEIAEQAAGDPAAFARAWRAVAARWSFYSVNELIDRHNRFYPAEARLPMDPRTQDFVLVNGERYDRRPLDAQWILARFPADLHLALSYAA